MSEHDYFRAWTRLWNGRVDLIDQVIHPDFVAHSLDRTFGREQLRSIIIRLRNHFDVYSVRPDVGPVVQGDLVAGRWVAVAVSAGEASHWVGQSIFRIEDAQIIEHWEVVTQLQGKPFAIGPA